MQIPSIFYFVKVRIAIYNRLTSELEFSEFQKVFFNYNPILAREAAFSYYESYVHGLLLAQGYNETEINGLSERDITVVLNPFVNPGTSSLVEINGSNYTLPDSVGNGIRVSYTISEEDLSSVEIPHISIIDENEKVIHWVNEDNPGMPFPVPLQFLEDELEFYKDHGYETKDYETKVSYVDYDEWQDGYEESAFGTHTILRTPFDWTGYDRPHWWGQYIEDSFNYVSEELAAEVQEKKQETIEELISKGETQTVEFKPALLYHFEKQTYSMSVRFIIAKVLASFLNSKGGKLLVGVKDDGTVQGVSYDFSLAQPAGKDPKDYFKLEVDKIIREYFKDSASNISGDFQIVNGVEIFVFTVFPSVWYPVFLKGQFNKEFYVRLTTSCEPYTDVEEIVKYCLTHWNTDKK